MSGRINGADEFAVQPAEESTDTAHAPSSPDSEETWVRPRVRRAADRGVLAESATIISVIILAVSLGVVSGIWINRRVSPASAAPPASMPSSSPASTQPLPDATATALRLNATAVRPEEGVGEGEGEAARTATPAAPPPASVESPNEVAAGMRDGEEKDEAGVEKARGDNHVVPNGREKSSEKIKTGEGDDSATASGVKAARRQAGVGPCSLSASASSVTVRAGGAASVTLSFDAGELVTASTPDWADIAVFAESKSAGAQRFSIRSVSKRAGVYRASFRTPCGSKSVQVTVTPT
jgi:hypothetical protein